jgi:hypothetical protein
VVGVPAVGAGARGESGVNRQELRRHQVDSAAAYLFPLIDRCRLRVLNAVHLIGADPAQWPGLTRAADASVDFGPLWPFWLAVIDRYNREVFDPQTELFGEPEPQLTRFSQFVHWRVWPALAKDNECVRNVLRALRLLPSHDSQRAMDALVYFIGELPIGMRLAADPGQEEYP